MRTDLREALNRLDPDLVNQFIRLAGVYPDQIRDFLEALKDDEVKNEPVDDYITDLDRRLHLFDQIRQHYRDSHPFPPTASIFALFMVAPVEEIETFIATTQQSPYCRQILGFLEVDIANAIKTYIQKGSHPAGPSERSPTIADSDGPVSRGHATSAGGLSAMARDRHTCIISGKTHPDAAQLFPSVTGASGNGNLSALNQILQDFWGAPAARAWRDVYEDTGITYSAKNYISLEQRTHFLFDTAKFALKPLRHSTNNNKEITVQWHWLRTTMLKPNTKIGDDDDDPLSWAGLESDGKSWGETYLLEHRRKSGVPIKTGDTFVIRADINPDELPSFELLELHWNLARVAAICGAGEAADKDFEPGYGFDEEDEA